MLWQKSDEVGILLVGEIALWNVEMKGHEVCVR